MPASELVEILAQFDVSISEQELTEPTPSTVKRIFMKLLEVIKGVHPEDITQPQFAAMEKLEFADIHDQSIGEVHFYREVKDLLETSGYSSFGIRDVLAPTGPRLMKQLYAIYEFAEFREQTLNTYTDYRAAHNELVEKRLQATEQLENLRRQLAELQAKKIAEQPRIQELRVQQAQLESEITSLGVRVDQSKDERGQLTQANKELAERIANNRFILTNIQQESGRLKSQIVQSPEKMRRMLDDMGRTLEAERRALATSTDYTRALRAREAALNKVTKQLAKTLSLMDEVNAERVRARRSEKDAAELDQRIVSLEQEARHLETKAGHMRRQIEDLAEKKRRAETQWGAKLEAAQLAVEEAVRERAEAEAACRELRRESEAKTAMAREVQARTDALKRSWQIEKERIKENIEQLANVQTAYMKKLEESWTATLQTVTGR